jgi:endo-1,4-beta-xylanase
MSDPGPLWRARRPGRSVALTFDDGPAGATTEALLDGLAERRVPAVFCVVGSRVATPGGGRTLRRTVAEGHLLGNHGWSYADLGGWPAARVRGDLVATQAAIADAVGLPVRVPYFRAANGSWGRSAAVARDLGLAPLDVRNTIDDWRTQDPATLRANLRRAVRPGELLLAHDGGGDRRATVAAVLAVVDELLAKGWSFSLPEDPAADAGPLTSPGCRGRP